MSIINQFHIQFLTFKQTLFEEHKTSSIQNCRNNLKRGLFGNTTTKGFENSSLAFEIIILVPRVPVPGNSELYTCIYLYAPFQRMVLIEV